MSWQSRVRGASFNGKKKRKVMFLNENPISDKQMANPHRKVTENITVTKNVKTSNKWIYLFLMARVALWALAMSSAAVFVSYYTDTPVPDEIPEKWKVRIIDASMRTYRHMVSGTRPVSTGRYKCTRNCFKILFFFRTIKGILSYFTDWHCFCC